MVKDDKPFEQQVMTRLEHLNATIQGIVTGVVAGGCIFLATIFLVLKGGRPVGPHLGLLAQFLPGYEVTFRGSLIGLVYGFVLGFIAGYALAMLYNWLADWRNGPHRGHAGSGRR